MACLGAKGQVLGIMVMGLWFRLRGAHSWGFENDVMRLFCFSTTLWPAWKLGSEKGWVGKRGPVSERERARERETEGGADTEGAAGGLGGVQGSGFRV
jgi:hypothetical protein